MVHAQATLKGLNKPDLIKLVLQQRHLLTYWGEGASLAMVGDPSSHDATIKMPYRVDDLHQPASHPIFSYPVV